MGLPRLDSVLFLAVSCRSPALTHGNGKPPPSLPLPSIIPSVFFLALNYVTFFIARPLPLVPILLAMHGISALFSFLGVVTIPMARVRPGVPRRRERGVEDEKNEK